ncbi:MAG: CRISPR-associated protein Csx3 [Okeania sp. SIO3I5]|uniref:CRISPR-associated protein Csx3 n=1 Tax=Okeania sp. SIO3I5 TaxID=2607805 RepID=UPI0013BC241D|nr:CRISPR-associated protein Csx3 [Okeania sp. SIO3I5]NEQ36897.1 CRISPR-associated protein Csx3 [Okeania sp. SIO3I5]
MTREFPLQLDVIQLETELGSCQTLAITFTQPQDLIKPIILSQLKSIIPEDLDFNQGVILYGASPNWLYGYLVKCCRNAPWIACYDVRTQKAVVVKSNFQTLAVGDTISVIFNRTPGMAILIGGPPDSGKSVFSYALRRSLFEKDKKLKVFIQRANWDGEGNWVEEMSDRQVAKRLKDDNTVPVHKLGKEMMNSYFGYHAKAIKNIRDVMDIVLVDIGGMVQEEKKPILEQCSHYVIISRCQEEVGKWHDFCRGLNPAIVIHSVLEEKLVRLENEDYLEVVAGRWITGETVRVPDIIVEKVLSCCRGVRE